MARFTERDVEEFACLPKQMTERVACQHSPRHIDLADAIIQGLGTKDPVTQRAIRSATLPRRRGGRPHHDPGPADGKQSE